MKNKKNMSLEKMEAKFALQEMQKREEVLHRIISCEKNDNDGLSTYHIDNKGEILKYLKEMSKFNDNEKVEESSEFNFLEALKDI